MLLGVGIYRAAPDYELWSVSLGFVVYKGALGWFFFEYFGFPMSVLFHICSNLIFIFKTSINKKAKSRCLGKFQQNGHP
jgi:hypothetical protein